MRCPKYHAHRAPYIIAQLCPFLDFHKTANCQQTKGFKLDFNTAAGLECQLLPRVTFRHASSCTLYLLLHNHSTREERLEVWCKPARDWSSIHSETVDFDQILLRKLVANQEGGHILALVSLQLYDLA